MKGSREIASEADEDFESHLLRLPGQERSFNIKVLIVS
jgi:hypothetical protein